MLIIKPYDNIIAIYAKKWVCLRLGIYADLTGVGGVERLGSNSRDRRMRCDRLSGKP